MSSPCRGDPSGDEAEQPDAVVPADVAQPVVAEAEPGEALELVGVGVRDGREVAAEQHLGLEVDAAAAAGRGGYGASASKKSVNTIVVSRWTRSWVSARSRNSAYSGAPMCAMTAVSRGNRASTRRSGSGPVNSLPTGPEPAWITIGVPASSSDPPDRVEQRVVEVELPHLHVHLEHLDAGAEQLVDVRRGLRLGVERRRPQRLRHVARRSRRPSR